MRFPVAFILLLVLGGCQQVAAPEFVDTSITLPTAEPTLPEQTGQELVAQNCVACHSADMILNQPRLTRAQWKSNVEKMVKVYKANIDDKDVEPIVDYLVAINFQRTELKTAP